MKCKLLLLIGCIIVLAGCSDDEQGIGEAVSTPDKPEGSDTVYCLQLSEYISGGAKSSLGHAIEYRFDLDSNGIHDYTVWDPVATVVAEWPDTGQYNVKAQARCTKHNEIKSPWSEGRTVTVIEPPVSRPSMPTGRDSTETDEELEYCSGGAVHTQGDLVEYRFDFDAEGVRDTTDWNTSSCERVSWSSPGEYLVRAQARSVVHISDVSPWSEGLAVKVTSRFISTPTIPLGPSSPAMPGDRYCTGGSVSIEGDPIEYSFSYEAADGSMFHRSGTERRLAATPWDTIPCTSISFPAEGVYIVRSKARSTTQTFKQSAWSDGLTVIAGRAGQPPEIRFSTHITEILDGSVRIISRPYNLNAPDTVGMYRPFSIGYHGVSPNGSIGAYLYGPSWLNLPGENRWTADLSDTFRYFSNTGDQLLREGDFYFRARCFDNEGFASPVDIPAGIGVCRVVVNHDPDTRILFGENFFTDGSGSPRDELIDFDDVAPDTLPYNSLLRMHYVGWDNPRDSLEFTDPPIPMRFQFKFERWGHGLSGGISSYRPAWMPEQKAEDTNCYSDEDSTTMRVGSYDYLFLSKSFDEQYRYDHTPDTVAFVGNFPPTIDKVSIAFDSIPYSSTLELADIKGDTVFIAIGQPLAPRPEMDYVSAYMVEYDANNEVFNQFFKLYINGKGHDDYRDPPGSGVKGWYFSIEAEEDYYYQDEKEWLYGFDPDTIVQEIIFSLVIPKDPDFPNYPRPDPEFVNNLPLWMGNQDLTVTGSDLHATELFNEGIRGISPTYVDDDPCNALIAPGRWISQSRGIANYARTDSYNGWFYMKLVY